MPRDARLQACQIMQYLLAGSIILWTLYIIYIVLGTSSKATPSVKAV